MSEYDDLIAQEPERFRAKVKMVEDRIQAAPIEQQPEMRKVLLGTLTREQAIEYGGLLGQVEADSRRETGDWRAGRIARAKMYAAWEFDGKPMGRGAAYREEFGVADVDIGGFLQREAEWRKRGEQK